MSWKNIFLAILMLMLVSASALIGAAAGGFAVYQYLEGRLETSAPQVATLPVEQPQTGTTQPVQSIQVSSSDVETAVTSAVETVGPAVVTVVGTVQQRVTDFFGSSLAEGEVSGSGVIISSDGYILTNNHVVEGAKNLYVILADGSELPAKLVNTDVFADLAVIKADGNMPAVATLGNSDLLKPGETVIAIGSPLGDFKNTVTVGVISATGRSLSTQAGYQMEDLIQTDAAINEGNSGGPLVNLNSEVIGINTLVVRGSGNTSTTAEGLGFAIPANTARIISEQIVSKGYFARPYLGVNWQGVTPNIARRYDLPVEWGAYVTEVASDSPAGRGGLQTDDIIVRIGDTRFDEDHSFINLLFAHQPGETVPVEVVRQGQSVELQITLGETSANQ
jgi:2-alkenal reductase